MHDISANSLDNCRAAHDNYAGIYLAVDASESDIAATRARLTYTTDLASAVAEADLVIEAVPDIPAVKTEVYESMAGLLPEHTLVATNSSTLLARDFTHRPPGEILRLHFANLIWIMNVVEIMAHPTTQRRRSPPSRSSRSRSACCPSRCRKSRTATCSTRGSSPC